MGTTLQQQGKGIIAERVTKGKGSNIKMVMVLYLKRVKVLQA